MSFTENPSKDAIELKKREQNLKFINYCPKCDEWMQQSSEINARNLKSQFTCKCGYTRYGSPTQLLQTLEPTN
jgi:transcription elongation factor Elf1